VAEVEKGLLMVFTGNGKGKTTSALGMTFRALGHGKKVCFIQFIKGSWKYGEINAADRLKDLIDFNIMGRGFTFKSDDINKDTALAKKAWETAKNKILSKDYNLVILDEITYPFSYGILDEDKAIEFLANRPSQVHVLITGRGASEKLMDAADMVTEMKDIKHHYKAGIKAQKGIEF